MHEFANCRLRASAARLLLPVLIAAMLLLGQQAQAVIIDPAGDFLSVYTGPRNGDLDVLSASATRSGTSAVTLTASHAAAIGTTVGSAYIWGINRGAGIEPFPTFDPPVGEGVYFDSYVTLFADGTGTFTDLILGGVQELDPAAITIAGATISVRLTSGLLQSQGFAFEDYLYNIWPRYAPAGVEPGSNTQISDFAPDASSFAAAVPEPATWALMLGGFGLAGARLRRRRAATVSA